MPVLIRKAEYNDSGQISELERRIFCHDTSDEEIKKQIEDKDVYYFIALIDGRVVGYLSAKTIFDEADLWYIAVDLQYRNQGIGNQLMKEFMKNMNENGIQKITLEVRRSNQNAIHLYEKYSYEQISIRKNYYSQPIEDAVIFQYIKKDEMLQIE